MLCENFKGKNKKFIHSELPKIAILPPKAAWSCSGLQQSLVPPWQWMGGSLAVNKANISISNHKSN